MRGSSPRVGQSPQPIAVPRYYRVPGEAYGRGPVLLALPSIKTLNKAQSSPQGGPRSDARHLGLSLRRNVQPRHGARGARRVLADASTGGRPGTGRLAYRPPTGRLDVARMVIGNLQADIKQTLFDVRIPEYEGTPRSASEIAGRLRQKAETHIGAFGRLTNEIMPVIAPRVAEILYDAGFLSAPINIDQFLIATSVQSPMAAR